jgi:hypothetical protein
VLDSAGLSAAERRANLANTFEVAGTVPPGALVVLVDDVVSSGATLAEAAAALGVAMRRCDPPVLAAAVAATPRTPAGTTSAGNLRVVRNRSEIVFRPSLDRLSGPGRRD